MVSLRAIFDSVIVMASALSSLIETDISTRDIKDAMLRYLEDVEKTPSPHWIGGALKRFGLLEKSEKTKEGYRYLIRKETVEDVRERYEV